MNASRLPHTEPPTDLIGHLRNLAVTRPADTALIVAKSQGETLITYEELDRRVRALAAGLQARFEPGSRVLLLLDNDDQYVVAFLGCVYAGLIAVPAFPPGSPRPHHLARLHSIARDARARCILTSAVLLPLIERAKELLQETEVLLVDTVPSTDAHRWQPCVRQDRDVLFLQYTSGSTAAPKGVIVDHGNLLANERVIQSAMQTTTSDVFVSWLPLFRDMGLVGGLLQPLYRGIPLVLMSPAFFLERPARWLDMISRYRGSIRWRSGLCLSPLRGASHRRSARFAGSVELASGVLWGGTRATGHAARVHRALLQSGIRRGRALSLLRPCRGDALRLRRPPWWRHVRHDVFEPASRARTRCREQ